MPESRFDGSDRLAIALACIGGIVAIILFLAEKTPSVVVSLLLLMLALSVFPVFHFVKKAPRRLIWLAGILVSTVVFGTAIWPKKTTLATPEPAVAAPTLPTSPAPSQSPSPFPSPSPSASPKAPRARVNPTPNRPSVNAPNGIAIGGDNRGTATVNNYGSVIPEPRVLDPKKFEKLYTSLRADRKRTADVTVVGDKDGESSKFGDQVAAAFSQAGWQVVKNFSGQLVMTIVTDNGAQQFDGGGLHCYADNNSSVQELVVKAFQGVGLECKTTVPLAFRSQADIHVVIGQR